MFDLNIDNYDKKELEDLLDLTHPYNNDSVNSNISLLKQQIMSDYTSSEIITSDIYNFLICVTVKLIIIKNKIIIN